MDKIKPKRKKLTDIEKRRLAILRDALKQLNCQNIIAKSGQLIEIPNSIRKIKNRDRDLQPIIQKAFEKGNFECEVCIRGGLLLSTINKENSFTVDNLLHTYGGTYCPYSNEDKRLSEVFEPFQIAMMETAFEQCHNYSILGNSTYSKCTSFGESYDNSKDRMQAILKNAIANRGTFKP